MGRISIMEKIAVNLALTRAMWPLFLETMILMSSIKVLTTELSKPAIGMKIL